MSAGRKPRAVSAWATGASLMASGLVPMTSRMSADCSLPPSSAGGMCLHYGASASSAEIVGVSLELEAHGRGGDHVVVEPMLLAVSDRRFAGREVHSDLRVRIARAVPARERIGTKRLFPFEFEQPGPAVGFAGLGRPAIKL